MPSRSQEGDDRVTNVARWRRGGHVGWILFRTRATITPFLSFRPFFVQQNGGTERDLIAHLVEDIRIRPQCGAFWEASDHLEWVAVHAVYADGKGAHVMIEEHVHFRTLEIATGDSNPNQDSASGTRRELQRKPTLKETFFDPVIRKAAWVGCTLSVLQ